MFDPPEDARLAGALRGLPVPPLSADFDDRVLAALRVPVPWQRRLTWRGVWQPVRPLLAGASCSLALTLLLLHLTLSGPLPAPVPPAAFPLASVPSAPLPPVDALLDRPNLCAGSLAAWTAALPAGAAAPEEAPRQPEPRRRASAVCRRPFLTA